MKTGENWPVYEEPELLEYGEIFSLMLIQNRINYYVLLFVSA